MNNKIDLLKFQSLKLSLSQLKYFSENNDALKNSHEINFKNSDSRSFKSIDRLIKLSSFMQKILESEKIDTSLQSEITWLKNAIAGYLAQSGIEESNKPIDYYLGLGGVQGATGDKAITEINRHIEKGYLSQAFYFSEGKTWGEKEKNLASLENMLMSDWQGLFSVMINKLMPSSPCDFTDLFVWIKNISVSFNDLDDEIKAVLYLVLSAETTSKKALKKTGFEQYDVIPPSQLLDKNLLKSNKAPLLKFKNKNTKRGILRDLTVFDDFCGHYDNYVHIRKLIELESKQENKKRTKQIKTKASTSLAMNHFLY